MGFCRVGGLVPSLPGLAVVLALTGAALPPTFVLDDQLVDDSV